MKTPKQIAEYVIDTFIGKEAVFEYPESAIKARNEKWKKMKSELEHLRADRDKWKDEYENLCKFTTDYEQQRDVLRAENEALLKKEEQNYKAHSEAVERILTLSYENKCMAEALEFYIECGEIWFNYKYDSDGEVEGTEVEFEKKAAEELKAVARQALAQSPKSQALLEVERAKDAVVEAAEIYAACHRSSHQDALNNRYKLFNKLEVLADIKKKASQL